MRKSKKSTTPYVNPSSPNKKPPHVEPPPPAAFYYLHDLGAGDVPYLTNNEFENLSTNTNEEEDEGIETPGTWCLIKK